MLSNSIANSQNANSVFGKISSNAASPILFLSVDTINCKNDYMNTIQPQIRKYTILDEKKCKDSIIKWYITFYEGKKYFVAKDFFYEQDSIKKQLDIIKIRLPNIDDRYDDLNREYQLVIEQKKLDEQSKLKRLQQEEDSLIKLLDKTLSIYRDKNYVLWEWYFSYSNEYSSFVDVDITIINPYKKKIKYVWFSFKAFNPVDDPVRDGLNGAIIKTVKGIGPIDYGDKGTYNFESVYYSKVISTMKVSMIKIQFFDGTIKTITNPVEVNRRQD